MAFNSHKDLKYILHPYVFVLKENPGIQNDLFDYSLCIMKIGAPEVMSSKQNTSFTLNFTEKTELL